MDVVQRGKQPRSSDISYWVFVLPALVMYTLLFIAPSLYNVYLSFVHWRGFGFAQTPAGGRNYMRLLGDTTFLESFRNTMVLMAVGTVLMLFIVYSSMFALRAMRTQKVIRSVVFFPQVIAPVAIGTALGFILDPNGVLNSTLRGIGLGNLARPWLAPQTVFTCIILGIVWSTSGLFVVLMMSAVDAIPEHLYEAAKLAGASVWQQFWHVTFPLTRDMLSVVVVLCTIDLMKVFDFVYTLLGAEGAPTPNARTLALQQFLVLSPPLGIPSLGYGAAIGVVFILLVVLLMGTMGRLFRHETVEVM